MKRIIKFIIPFMVISMLCSCSGKNNDITSTSDTQSSTTSVSAIESDKPSEESDAETSTAKPETTTVKPETSTTSTPKPETTTSKVETTTSKAEITTTTPKTETTTSKKPETTTTATPKPETTTTTTTAKPPEVSNDTAMPVLYINTVSTDKNAINFVTKPVATHVSQQIASWTPNYVMPPAPYYEDCTITLSDDSTLLLENIEAKVKVRGNWTTTYDKKPLRIKFNEKQNMAGLNGGAQMKNWVLIAEYKDASMLRNKATFQIAEEILGEDGLYVSDTEFVEVYINEKYWGVYLLAEYQQINKNRVNITEAEKDYTETDIGYFLEMDGYCYTEDELQQFYIDYANNAPLTPYDGKGGSGRTIKYLDNCDGGFTIKSDIYSEKQKNFISNYVDKVYDILYYAAYKDEAYVFNSDYTAIQKTTDITPREAIEKVVNVESLVDTYIINEIGCDADIYWSSFYMSVDFGEGGDKKLTFCAPWDFDSGLGNKNRCADGKGYYASNIVPDVNGGPYGGGEFETLNPWLVVLAYEDWYRDMIEKTWTDAYDRGVFTRAYEMIENTATNYSEMFDRNYDKWNNIRNNDSFKGELSYGAARCKTHKQAVDYLNSWLMSRVEFLNGEFHK